MRRPPCCASAAVTADSPLCPPCAYSSRESLHQDAGLPSDHEVAREDDREHACAMRGRSRHDYTALDPAWYWSSLTFSIQSTVLPFSASWMAMCVIAVVGVAPCQCFSPGGNQTTSPGRISSIGPPSRWTRPDPAVTISTWPSGWVCHAVRAPGSKVTSAIDTRAGSGGLNSGSRRTVPVKYSSEGLADGC